MSARRRGRHSLRFVFSGQVVYSASLSSVSPTLVEAQQSWPMSHANTALFPSLLAGSMVAAGFGTVRCVVMFGRRRVVGVAAVMSALSSAGVAVSPDPVWLLVATTALGLFSSAILVGLMSELAAEDSGLRAQRMLQVAFCASVASLAGPWLTTFAAGTPAGWRGAWWLLAAAFALLATSAPHISQVAEPSPGQTWDRAVLSLRCKRLAACTAVGVSGELCFVYFAPQAAVHSGLSSGGLILVPYYLGELIGRLLSAQVCRRGGTEEPLLGLALLLALTGFGTFWLAEPLPLRLTGMLIAGVGVGNFLPLGASIVAAAARGAEDHAMSYLQLVLGISAFVAPLVLGVAATGAGLPLALGVIPVLFSGMAGTLWLGWRRRPSQAPTLEPSDGAT